MSRILNHMGRVKRTIEKIDGKLAHEEAKRKQQQKDTSLSGFASDPALTARVEPKSV